MERLVCRLFKISSQPALLMAGIIPWACPVPYFGSLFDSRIATLSLNPSNIEFMDSSSMELSGNQRRFPTLNHFNLRHWNAAGIREAKQVLNFCDMYFRKNPYKKWFNPLNDIISETGFSYYLNTACHLDLVPFATIKKWGGLNATQKSTLLHNGVKHLPEVLNASNIDVIIANGQSTVNYLNAWAKLTPKPSLQPTWQICTNTERPVNGYSYEGTLTTIGGISLNRQIRFLGFNHNIQSSVGMTHICRREIQTWVTNNI